MVFWRWRRINPLGPFVTLLGVVLVIAFMPWWLLLGIIGFALIAIGVLITRGY
ncbi:MAG: hypothetical protein ACYC5Y_08810 [Symbiobacteriia bacterium]